MTLIFGFGSYVLYASIYKNNTTSSVAYFYEIYQPV